LRQFPYCGIVNIANTISCLGHGHRQVKKIEPGFRGLTDCRDGHGVDKS
jgi:hypothetical protein